MKLKIIDGDKEGERQWMFCFNDQELREVFMDVLAWNIFNTTEMNKCKVIEEALRSEKKIPTVPDEDIDKIRHPFVRAVVGEKKRLAIK